MEDELIKKQTALLAKKVGFNIPTRHFYADESWKDEQVYACNEVGYPEYTKDMGNNHGFGDITLIPTQTTLHRWLREVKEENIIPPLWFSYQGYACDIMGFDNTEYFKTYEEALENELYECLQRISETVA